MAESQSRGTAGFIHTNLFIFWLWIIFFLSVLCTAQHYPCFCHPVFMKSRFSLCFCLRSLLEVSPIWITDIMKYSISLIWVHFHVATLKNWTNNSSRQAKIYWNDFSTTPKYAAEYDESPPGPLILNAPYPRRWQKADTDGCVRFVLYLSNL